MEVKVAILFSSRNNSDEGEMEVKNLIKQLKVAILFSSRNNSDLGIGAKNCPQWYRRNPFFIKEQF